VSKSAGDKFGTNRPRSAPKGDSRFANRDKSRQARRSFV
jgi:hypothetical protein